MDLLDRIEAILQARTIEDAWDIYVDRLTAIGFPHSVYGGHRLLGTVERMILDDGLALSSLPDTLHTELLEKRLCNSLPMLSWMTRNHGMQSWDWVHKRRMAGKLAAPESQSLAIFERYGLSAGIALSLSDRVPRVRAGLLLIGPSGATQKQIDRIWQKDEREIIVLSSVLHQRLSNLPYREPEQILTLRQREALELTGSGLSTQEIAECLDLTPGTVEKHLRLARKSLGARTTAQAVLLAMSRRQIFCDPGESCAPVPSDMTAMSSGAFPKPWTYLKFVQVAQHLPNIAKI
ncbi:helix-turn-helix transcriptional regulator [Paracoccus laeviglucosivorans]|uniref:DNA-binding transcriptional regulator, CsgD family n=1 Tax=Paracoccus laeviglucosivorans TaxID=1197861 RepID=A0A521D5L3_9RHOB|nr:LuxR family transcriptional regulator [Paracoccus laeviglucosivorans]SMO66984.1 DNA-binding transcriptional regulator, CsgD family [Paracoccus laeviglucosivorans]